jgi:hypothetical protein
MVENHYFGLYEFITGLQGMRVDIKSGDFTILYSLKKEDFLSVLKDPEFQEDVDVFCMLKDKIILSNVFHDLKIKCFSCNSNLHLIDKCPVITYIPN